jgi:hypothetical protein
MSGDAHLSASFDSLAYKNEFVPQVDSISPETVINMLVRKGICTADELFILEGQIREKKSIAQQVEYVRIKQTNENQVTLEKWLGLKRVFVRYHWTRWLGAKLFGWRWKKVKRSTSVPFKYESPS